MGNQTPEDAQKLVQELEECRGVKSAARARSAIFVLIHCFDCFPQGFAWGVTDDCRGKSSRVKGSG